MPRWAQADYYLLDIVDKRNVKIAVIDTFDSLLLFVLSIVKVPIYLATPDYPQPRSCRE